MADYEHGDQNEASNLQPEARPTPPPGNQPKSTGSGGGKAFVIGLVAIILALIAIGIAYFGMRQQSSTEQAIKQQQLTLNQEISQRSDQLKSTIQSASAQALQSAKTQIDQSIQQSEAQLRQQQSQLAASLGATQQKMQQLINLSGKNQTQWVLGETEYMLRLANLDLTIGGNVSATIHLLKLSDERLSRLSDESVNIVRAAIAKDIATLQAVSQTDVAGLVFKLDALNQQVDKLPGSPSRMLAQNMQQSKPVQAKSKNWKDHMNKALTSFKSFFVIRHTNQKQAPLLEPQQIVFLKENIRLKLAQAEWAVMHQDQQLYLSSIALAEKWLSGYNEGDMNAKQEIIQALDQLKAINVKPDLPNILTSLQALHQYTTQSAGQISTRAQTRLPFDQKTGQEAKQAKQTQQNAEAEKLMESHAAGQGQYDQKKSKQNTQPQSEKKQPTDSQPKDSQPEKKNPFSDTGIHKQPLNPSIAI